MPQLFKVRVRRQEERLGRILDGRTYDEMPTRTTNPVPDKKERLAMIDMFAKGAGTV